MLVLPRDVSLTTLYTLQYHINSNVTNAPANLSIHNNDNGCAAKHADEAMANTFVGSSNNNAPAAASVHGCSGINVAHLALKSLRTIVLFYGLPINSNKCSSTNKHFKYSHTFSPTISY